MLTELLARKACESTEDVFADYAMTDEQWEAIRTASWLHDCGKVTTPEFVVDWSLPVNTYSRIRSMR